MDKRPVHLKNAIETAETKQGSGMAGFFAENACTFFRGKIFGIFKDPGFIP